MREVTLACEGYLDEVILKKLCQDFGLLVSASYPAGSKTKLDGRISGYVNASRFKPWIIQRDLDQDAECGISLADRLVTEKPDGLCLIISVRQSEAWLLADRESLARFLKVRPAQIASQPDTLPDAKKAVVALAQKSSSRNIRNDMVPSPQSGRTVGPGYTSTMQQFITRHWQPRAELPSPSLRILLRRLEYFKHHGRWRP